MTKPKKPRLGKLKPRYTFILNPYPNERISTCIECRKPTHPRKFPLVIGVEDFGILTLGKTCRYCAKCEIIVAHQHELEHELTHNFEQMAPQHIGKPYLLIGTMDKKLWKRGLSNSPEGDALENIADFKKVMDLVVEPARWEFKEEA